MRGTCAAKAGNEGERTTLLNVGCVVRSTSSLTCTSLIIRCSTFRTFKSGHMMRETLLVCICVRWYSGVSRVIMICEVKWDVECDAFDVWVYVMKSYVYKRRGISAHHKQGGRGG